MNQNSLNLTKEPSITGEQASVCPCRLPEGEADHCARPRLLLRPDGEAGAAVPPVHPPLTRSLEGDAAGTPGQVRRALCSTNGFLEGDSNHVDAE